MLKLKDTEHDLYFPSLLTMLSHVLAVPSLCVICWLRQASDVLHPDVVAFVSAEHCHNLVTLRTMKKCVSQARCGSVVHRRLPSDSFVCPRRRKALRCPTLADISFHPVGVVSDPALQSSQLCVYGHSDSGYDCPLFHSVRSLAFDSPETATDHISHQSSARMDAVAARINLVECT